MAPNRAPSMPRHRIVTLPYQADGTAWLQRLRHWPHPVWLDSAWPYSQRGRWDIISADPIDSLALPVPAGTSGDGFRDGHSLFAAFQDMLDEQLVQSEPHTGDPAAALPFTGGLIGAAAYPMGCAVAGLCQAESGDFPGAWAGFYDWALLTDHHQRRSLLVAHPRCSEQRWRRLRRELAAPCAAPAAGFALTSRWQSNLEAADYRRAFDRIQHYIRAGDSYQVNLARRFRAGYRGDPFAAYCRLRALAAAPYSAYLELPGATLLSLSPERFLQVRQGRLLTQPIKGTAARHPDPARDREQAEALLRSVKNRAENVMIVDLLRNDLGRVARTGSVRVSALLELQSFATVHHLVSTIEAQLAPGCSALQALSACFPGGSITGAPKRRAMQIIDELEPDQRDYYCGSVFWADATTGNLDSNIAIRSLVCRNGTIDAWSGGGIVADSDCEEEFAETEIKMGRLLAALDA